MLKVIQGQMKTEQTTNHRPTWLSSSSYHIHASRLGEYNLLWGPTLVRVISGV